MNIIKTITDWPIIIQGALGSALFWVILTLGQRVARRIFEKVEEDRVASTWFALAAHEATGEIGERSRFICIYAAIHYLLKALIVAVISFSLSDVINVFAVVGYFISAAFLFRALTWVPHTKSLGPTKARKLKFDEHTNLLFEKYGPKHGYKRTAPEQDQEKEPSQ